ncbi:HAD family hydrolase [Secundilactobacillus folii]|nr:HAD family hydrolase [Secundilactobacillus folii]
MKTFIFDIDGTLLDTEAMYMKALDQVLRRHQIVHPYHELTQTFGITSLDALKRLRVPDDLIEPILKEWTAAIPAFQSLAHVYDGIEAMLQKLNAQKDVQVAIMTSKRQFEFKRDVTPLGLDKYFSEFVFFEDYQRGKPAPDPILVALKRLRADRTQTVYIGDTQYDLQAAHAAGVKFGLVAWGAKNQQGVSAADYVFAFPDEIVALAQE